MLGKKITLWLIILSLMVSLFGLSFAENRVLTLEEIRNLAIEKSPNLREIRSGEGDIKEKIRGNIQNSYKIENALDHYYDYVSLYNEKVLNEDPKKNVYAKYIGRSDSYLTSAIGYTKVDPKTGALTDAQGLTSKYLYYSAIGDTTNANKIEEEITFINFILIFGENPNLENKDKFSNFEKNKAMLQNSKEYILTKYEEGLEVTKNSVDSAIVNLYLNLVNATKALKIKEDLLKINQDALAHIEVSYNLGASSKIAYENQKYETEKVNLDVENFKLTIENLNYALKKACYLDFDKDYTIDTNISHPNFILLNDKSSYYEGAYLNNYEYITTKSEYDYNMKNFKVMDKYLPDEDDNGNPIYYKEKSDLRDTLSDLENKLFNIKSNMTANVNLAYNNLILKKELINNNNLALKEAKAKKSSAEVMFKQGQINAVTKDQADLSYYNEKFNYDKAVRDYDLAIERFFLLINNGILYTE